MSEASFRFYANLNDFLPAARKQVEFEHPFNGRVSIKDMIEVLGVPHTEIDLILVNGESVDFRYRAGWRPDRRLPGVRVVRRYAAGPAAPQPLRDPRFVLDMHLGKLAAYLRMVGFDTLYRNDYDDGDLARISHDERRILLTRDRGLLKRSMVTHGYCVRETNPRLQLSRCCAASTCST